MDDKISEVLGVKPIVTKKNELTVIETLETGPDAEIDYRYSRRTFRNLIKKGQVAVDDLYDLSKAAELPRAYEVLGNMIKVVSETTKDLYDLHKKKKDFEQVASPLNDGHVNIDKAVFVGTTAELLQKLKTKDSDGEELIQK
jgi:fructose-1,6-bisphosphatase